MRFLLLALALAVALVGCQRAEPEAVNTTEEAPSRTTEAAPSDQPMGR